MAFGKKKAKEEFSHEVAEQLVPENNSKESTEATADNKPTYIYVAEWDAEVPVYTAKRIKN